MRDPASEATKLAMAKALADPTVDHIATFGVSAFDDGYAAGMLAIADVLAQAIGDDSPLVRAMRDAAHEKQTSSALALGLARSISDIIQ